MKLRIRNYKRLINCIVITVFAFGVFYFSSATNTYSNSLPKKIIVSRGDTLWSIANKNYPNDYLPKKTFEIAEINKLDDGAIYPGQILILP